MTHRHIKVTRIEMADRLRHYRGAGTDLNYSIYSTGKRSLSIKCANSWRHFYSGAK